MFTFQTFAGPVQGLLGRLAVRVDFEGLLDVSNAGAWAGHGGQDEPGVFQRGVLGGGLFSQAACGVAVALFEGGVGLLEELRHGGRVGVHACNYSAFTHTFICDSPRLPHRA